MTFDGAATRKQIAVYLTEEKNGSKFDLLLYTPADGARIPVLNNEGIQDV